MRCHPQKKRDNLIYIENFFRVPITGFKALLVIFKSSAYKKKTLLTKEGGLLVVKLYYSCHLTHLHQKGEEC